jgi:hypothetical protein
VGEIIRVFGQTTASFCKKFNLIIGFWEKRQFFAKNWQKSQKIVVITSTQGCTVIETFFYILHKRAT